MKKFRKMMMMLMAVCSMGLMSSCDDDVNKSMALSGQWRGDFGMFYNYQYGNRIYTFDSYDTDVVFYPEYDYATHGWGKQVDYYDYGPYEYQYHYFIWEVRYGVIHLAYPHDHELDTDIFDYRLNDRYFAGHFGSSDSGFRLYKMADYYDWNRYQGDYYYYDRYNWYDSYYNRYPYYAKGKNGAKNVEAIEADSTATDGKIVGYGNRFKK